MAHVHKNRKQLLTRVRRIAGQVAALEQALDQPEGKAGDCADVLVQVAAVRGAAHSLLMELLHEHLQEHVVGADDPQQRADEAAVLEIARSDCPTINRGTGCETCGQTGYRGRVGLYELLLMSDAIRHHIASGADANVIRDQAIEEGMTTLREDALIKLKAGLTTPEEVVRVTRAL